MQTVLKRWRMNLTTGACTEEQLSERVMEFPMINQQHAGRPYRYAYNMTTEPGWFRFDGIVRRWDNPEETIGRDSGTVVMDLISGTYRA